MLLKVNEISLKLVFEVSDAIYSAKLYLSTFKEFNIATISQNIIL
jgi:hypothetical protein